MLPVHSPIHVAHQWASLDYVSDGRAILGVGLGRDHHYRQFQVPQEGRVRRFREEVELIRALWTEPRVDYHGRFFNLEDETMAPKPVQKPHLPIWMGVGHPDAVRRAADGRRRLDGLGRLEHRRLSPPRCRSCGRRWSGPGATRRTSRSRSACSWRSTSARRWRGAELLRWFTDGLPQPAGTDASGIHGTPEQVRERLEEMVAMGANHLLLNPVSRHAEQVEALAEVVGLT